VTRTRFAPSPTGDLHVGGAFVALASWWLSRRERAPGGERDERDERDEQDERDEGSERDERGGGRGSFVVRVEDLDPPRVVAGSAERILDDLAWLGLTWDGGVVAQSARHGAYERALARLASQGLTYPCDCSRAEIARAASAPHAGEETIYPGTCRDLDPGREMKRPPAIRLRVPPIDVAFVDGARGPFAQRLDRDVGDFVLWRGDGTYAYQLAVVVDDLDAGVTDVVRGADLLASTPRQIHLAHLLGAAPPRYVHLPLVRGPGGERLAKRTRGARVRALREAGAAPEAILGAMAAAIGLCAGPGPCTLHEIARAPLAAWAASSWTIPRAWADAAAG